MFFGDASVLGLHFELQWTSLDLVGAARDGPQAATRACWMRRTGLVGCSGSPALAARRTAFPGRVEAARLP